MRAITLQDTAATTAEEARQLLGELFEDGSYVVTRASGERQDVTFEGAHTNAPDPLALWQAIFPDDGLYQIVPGEIAKAVNIQKPYAEWFLEQLLDEARRHFARVQDVALSVVERLIRERAGHLTDPAVLAEFEQMRFVLRQGVRWSLGAPIPEPTEQVLQRLGFGDVEPLDWPGIAYRLGYVRAELSAPHIRDWQRIMDFAQAGPIGATDLIAMRLARERVARYLTPIALRTGEVMHEAALVREQQQLRTMTVQAIAAETHPLKLAREFHARFAPDGIERDWERLARTELMTARLEGAFAAERIAKAWTGDSKIYRQTAADPCNGCLKLYRNPDGTPKLYTVAEVEASDAEGPNRGPWQEWKPKIGASHPNDRCSPWLTASPELQPVFARHADRWARTMQARGLANAEEGSPRG